MRVDALAALLDLDDVDQHARSDPGGEPAGDLLAVGVGGQQHARPGRPISTSAASTSTNGVIRYFVDVVGLGDVDLGGAGRLQLVDQRRGGAGRADHDGGRLAQRAGGGDQFGGDLLHRTFGVLDEHKYFSHGLFASFSRMVRQV